MAKPAGNEVTLKGGSHGPADQAGLQGRGRPCRSGCAELPHPPPRTFGGRWRLRAANPCPCRGVPEGEPAFGGWNRRTKDLGQVDRGRAAADHDGPGTAAGFDGRCAAAQYPAAASDPATDLATADAARRYAVPCSSRLVRPHSGAHSRRPDRHLPDDSAGSQRSGRSGDAQLHRDHAAARPSAAVVPVPRRHPWRRAAARSEGRPSRSRPGVAR